MLTKDLLNFRKRAGKVTPVLIKPEAGELIELAEALVDTFRAAPGSSLGEVEDEIAGGAWSAHALTPALSKLLFDRCAEAEDAGEVATRRWELLQAAEKLRAQADGWTLADYQAAVAVAAGTIPASVSTLQEGLYADLPEHRLIKTFKPLSPTELLHRYNCAQIQGLLIHAQQVTITIKGASLPDKRRFFRSLKFARLLSDIELSSSKKDSGDITCVLSGPLSLFQNAQSYGLRLAQFFPYVLQLPRWHLHAEVKLAGKVFDLECDQRCGIESSYQTLTPFIPPEMTAFLATFNERDGAFKASLCEDYLHIGRQSYCFPDATFVDASGRKTHLELFHRWHAGQLAGRLAALAGSSGEPLILGVAQDVASRAEVAPLLVASAWFSTHGFVFKAMPTVKAVQQALQRHAAVGHSV